MIKQRLAVIVVAAFVAVFIVVCFTLNRFNSDSIDAHWTGVPLPPCFVDATGCFGHLLGTDNLGRDILARLLNGSIISLALALISIAVAVVLGLAIAWVSRASGATGRFLVERFAAAVECFPPLAFILIVIIVGTPDRLLTLPVIITATLAGLLFCPPIVRAVLSSPTPRGALVAVSDRSAKALSSIIALLAIVDFLGWGVQPPTPSLGNILNSVQEDIALAWWAAAFPAIWLCATLLVIEVLRRLLGGGARSADEKVSLV